MMQAATSHGTASRILAAAASALALAAVLLCGCAGGGQDGPVLADCPVSQDTSFGGVYIDMEIDDFNQLGFEFGDSVDIVFSNGYELRGIPYYNGYYVNVGDALLVGYPGYPYIKAAVNYGESLWVTAGLAEGDTATVTLAGHGTFRAVQEAFDITYTSKRSDYPHLSDAEYANFRSLSGGSLREGAVLRSASPIDNEYDRAAYVEAQMEAAGVGFVVDLSDNADEVDAFMAESIGQGVDVSYFSNLLKAGCVALLDLGANYMSQGFCEALAGGFTQMAAHDGPYLIHCIEGKDRTGFACVLLEALCGATYDEMLDDYMVTYANYYGITRESDPEKYDAIAGLNLDGMLRFLADAGEGDDLRALDYSGYARDYLLRGGMTDGEIDALVERISQG